MKRFTLKIKNTSIEIVPYCHWFWKDYSRYDGFPDIVNVYFGGPFFQGEYYETYCPKKHKNVGITGYN
jgi:hypothetical protein